MSASASIVAASAAIISAAAARPTASDTLSTGNAPTQVSTAIAARLAVYGSRISAEITASRAAMAQAPARATSSRPPIPVAARATSSGKVHAATRAACSQIQSRPSWTGSDAAARASMNARSNRVMPSVTTGARPMSGTSTSSPRCSESHRRARVSPPPAITAASTSPTGAATHAYTVVTAMTSMYAAATPVAASAIAPTRPPGRVLSRIPAATSPAASTAPAATRSSGRRMPACAARTSSRTTPVSVTVTPATARTLPIQPSERGSDGWGDAAGGGTGGRGGTTGRGGGGAAGGQ